MSKPKYLTPDPERDGRYMLNKGFSQVFDSDTYYQCSSLKVHISDDGCKTLCGKPCTSWHRVGLFVEYNLPENTKVCVTCSKRWFNGGWG